jgi:hypothetical protein
LDAAGALLFPCVNIKESDNGWVLFAVMYLDMKDGFVRGYSNNIGSSSTTGKDGEVVHRIRLKYISMVAAFLKQKKKAITKKLALSALQKRAIKQAVEYDKLVKEYKAAKTGARCDKVEKDKLAQKRGVSANNSSGLTYNFENGSPAVPLGRAAANAPVTASSKRNSHDASLFSPGRDPSTLKTAPVAATAKRTRYVDHVSGGGGGGPDDPSSGGGADGDMHSFLNNLVRNLGNEAALSGGQSHQAVGSAGIPAVAPAAAAAPAANTVLMSRLQAKLGRLNNYRKEAHGVQSLDDVKEYGTQIKTVQKEIEDLENTLLDQARDAANA